MLSSRSAAVEALSMLSASHTKLHDLATDLVDHLFPGDGSVRDETIMPFASLAFIAVTKARADLETYAKSFAGVLKTIDSIRASPSHSGASSPSPAVAGGADGAGQVESVGVLKRKYEEGLAAAGPKKTSPNGPKKVAVPKPTQAAKSAGATPNNAATSPETPNSPKSASSSSERSPAAQLPLPAAAPKHTEGITTSEDSTTPRSPRAPTATDSAEASSSDTTGPAANSLVNSTPNRSDPVSKEAMKAALAGMVLPARKKTASPHPSTVQTSSQAADAATVSPHATVAAASPDHSEDTNGSGRLPNSGKTKSSDPGTAGTTSDDEISSDEEEYLRGVEERRARIAAEKEERLRAAKEAREQRQNMYSFLTEEPPPGFIQTKPTSATKEKKTKKEKKDKPRDRLSSQGRSPSDTSLESAAYKGNAAAPGNGSANGSAHTTPTKRNDRNVSVTGAISAVPRLTDLDLSSPGNQNASSPSGNDPTPRTHARSTSVSSENSFATRYRPANVIDDSVWKATERAILNDPPPTRKRWEEYQAKYAAKQEASATKKVPSSSNLKNSGIISKGRSKSKSGSNDRDINNGLESPRRKSNADDSSPRRSNADDSPRRKSNADDSGDLTTDDKRSTLNRTDSSSRRPSPKLETVGDPRVYLFEAPSTESNLRFMERNGEEMLAGATIEKLIQHLTSATAPSPEYFQSFMLTYHNFLTPPELIELLRLRWNSQPSDPSKLESFVSKNLLPIRLRIVNVLRMWIETFGTDFKDEATVQALNSFIEYIRADNAQMADLVALKLKKFLAGHIFDTEGDLDEEPPPLHPIDEAKENALTLIDVHPEEFARQMVLVEHALFKSIPYKELLTNAKAGKANPNVANMISYTNHLVNWMGTQILKQTDLRQRALVLARLITIAKFCIHSCQNYNGAMEVLSTLRSSPVFRLKHTWNMLPDAAWDDYEWLEDLFESDNNYARYRKALSNAVPPCVPYLGRYLSEILFLNEIHPDYLTQGPPPLINFAKMYQVAEVLHHLQRYQKSPFCLTGSPVIQKLFLLKRGVMNEKDLYKVSLEREPRETTH